MAVLPEPVADPARGNPLYQDTVLFNLYMSALDDVLGDQEIRAASDEFAISPAALRMMMVTDARRVFAAAPQQFATYEEALAQQLVAATTRRTGSDKGPYDELRSLLSASRIGLGIAGAFVAAGGAASMAAWRWAQPMLWAGGTMLAVAGLSYGLLRVLYSGAGLRLFGGELFPSFSDPGLIIARDRLMAAISQDELMSLVRALVNTARGYRFGHGYTVADSTGLSDVHDRSYNVPTDVAAELDGLLGRLDGASIGIAGPRGSGKSTLIYRYCDEAVPAGIEPAEADWEWLLGAVRPDRVSGDLRCVVSAPVDYVARDFVLHLFAVFCRAVISRYRSRADDNRRWAHGLPGIYRAGIWLLRSSQILISLSLNVIFYGGAVAALLYWQEAIAHRLSVPVNWVLYAAFGIICLATVRFASWSARQIRRWARHEPDDDRALVLSARQHLARVRFLQTYTSGWSGALRLPAGGVAEGQRSQSLARAEQPLSYPEIVGEFRAFARQVAAKLHSRGDQVFVGVDELDKIGSAEQAERFLNEIKGIFGIPHLYFIVSVSDDALTAFERRGLPLRDAFDSSFDEILHVGPLGYAESRRLLYRRVIGLTEPYVALCHCLAGGLARDLIRAARQVVRAATAHTGGRSSSVTPARRAGIVPWFVPPDSDEFEGEAPAQYLLLRDEPATQAPTLAAISAAIVQDELRRKIRAVIHVLGETAPGQAQDLLHNLYDIARHLAPGDPAVRIVDVVGKPASGEPAAVTGVRLDFAAYAYFCATLQEVFTERLDTERMIEATRASPEPGTFDALAAARFAFTLDTRLAWRSITQFRQAWCLATRELSC